LPGDVFQLGNTSWRILRIGNGVVRVADAQGQPPSMPFWLGEAPARSAEMSLAVSHCVRPWMPSAGPANPAEGRRTRTGHRAFKKEYFLADCASRSPVPGGREGSLGAVPTIDTIALERFFDESGGMQLVLHAPFGSRINRAWGLALRKKFCQGFNFELQAAATEEGIILSLGELHSFPLEEVFRYLHPNTGRETLMQAMLASPIFETRWRWLHVALAAAHRGGARIPNQLQRRCRGSLQAVFPDAVACQDNMQGAREIPDHPLVSQAMRDALEEAVDVHGLERQLQRIYSGSIKTVARDTPEPSVLSHELLNSAVYTFLDPCSRSVERGPHTARDRGAVRRRPGASTRGDPACAKKRRCERPTRCTAPVWWRLHQGNGVGAALAGAAGQFGRSINAATPGSPSSQG
jgi:ATP-dependent Lhr-like helicase